MPDKADDEVATWLREFVAETLVPARLDALVAQSNASITAEVPEVLMDRELQRDLDASSRDQGRAFLTWLIQDSAEVAPPAAAYALARTIARRGLHLRVLMQIYRVGQRAMLGYQAEIAGNHAIDPALELKIMTRLWDRASHWLNLSLEILTDAYTEERELGLQGAYARRSETVQAIMRGEMLDATAASSRLGYPMAGYNTALVLWSDNPPTASSDGIGSLEGLVRTLAAAVGAHQVLTVPSGSRGLWAWMSGEAAPDLAVIATGSTLDLPAGVHIAVGNPGLGLPGFRRSHREALAAQSVSEHTQGQRGLTCYADVEIAHLLGGDPDAAGAMTIRELRGLTDADPASAQLRRTLRAYLAANRSPEVAARKLGVHKNTVRYRVQRAEEILGHPAGGPNRLKLELALEYAEIYGLDPTKRSPSAAPRLTSSPNRPERIDPP